MGIYNFFLLISNVEVTENFNFYNHFNKNNLFFVSYICIDKKFNRAFENFRPEESPPLPTALPLSVRRQR